MAERVRAFRRARRDGPTGIPGRVSNTDETDPAYPEKIGRAHV